MECFYIGQDYYFQSGTVMSSVYETNRKNGIQRTDWGKIQMILESGIEVLIRPATEDEMNWAVQKLRSIKASN